MKQITKEDVIEYIKKNGINEFLEGLNPQPIKTISEIRAQISFYESEEKRYEDLMKKYPGDFDFKREYYGTACKIYALKWVLLFRE